MPIPLSMRLTPRSSRGRRRPTLGRRVLPVVAALLVVAGCSSTETTSSSTTTARRTTTTSPELTTSEVEQLLLVTQDLPPNWSADTSSDATEPGETDGGAEDGEADLFCPAAVEPLRNEAHQGAEASFSRSTMGPEFMQSLLSAPDPVAHFDDVTKVFASCVGPPWTMDADGETMTMSMVATVPPDLGDKAASYRVTGTGSQGTTTTMDVAVVLRGSVVQAYLGVAFAAPGVATEQFGPDEFTGMVTSGDTKVADGMSGSA